MSDIEDLIASTFHAQAQLNSLLHGCDGRRDRLKSAKAELERLGSSNTAQFEMSCAISEEAHLAATIGKAVTQAQSIIGFLKAAQGPSSAAR